MIEHILRLLLEVWSVVFSKHMLLSVAAWLFRKLLCRLHVAQQL